MILKYLFIIFAVGAGILLMFLGIGARLNYMYPRCPDCGHGMLTKRRTVKIVRCAKHGEMYLPFSLRNVLPFLKHD